MLFMTSLNPCPKCCRHIRADDDACPFCSSPVEPRQQEEASPYSGPRLGRAAIFTFGATLAMASCSSAPLYGAPPRPGGTCGNGVLEAAEECDDGNINDHDSCHNNCTRNVVSGGGGAAGMSGVGGTSQTGGGQGASAAQGGSGGT